MAILGLDAPTPHNIEYRIWDITEEFIDTAKVELYYWGQSEPIKTAIYRSIDVARTVEIFGYFTDLKPATNYVVHEEIYDSNGNRTSYQTSSVGTPVLFTGTENSYIHSINIAIKNHVYNTFENWGLVPSQRPSITPPELKFKYVDLPAADGVLDYTELLLGKVPFGRRSGSWTFYTDERMMKHLGYTWDSLYSQLLTTIHGKAVEIQLNDDVEFFYKGRISVNQWRSSKAFSMIVIEYNCDSYKYSRTSSNEVDWQWDVCLEDPDFTILYGTYSTQEYKVLNFINPGEQVTTPTWKTTGVVTIKTNFGSLVQDVILGKYGSGQDRQEQLTVAGLCWQMVQNAVNEALGSSVRVEVPYDDPDPDVQARIAATEALANQGELYTGDEHTLQSGSNYNETLSLNPGDNVIISESSEPVNIDAEWKETRL